MGLLKVYLSFEPTQIPHRQSSRYGTLEVGMRGLTFLTLTIGHLSDLLTVNWSLHYNADEYD
jgi:hypothetical protein